jgi:hypothetical protein
MPDTWCRMSSLRRGVIRRLSIIALALASGGCVLGDLFQPDGRQPITLTYDGPVFLSTGCARPFAVIVHVGGTVVRNAWVSLGLAPESTLVITPRRDSLLGLSQGKVTLTARFESSMLVDSAVTMEQEIHVTSGPGTCP